MCASSRIELPCIGARRHGDGIECLAEADVTVSIVGAQTDVGAFLKHRDAARVDAIDEAGRGGRQSKRDC